MSFSCEHCDVANCGAARYGVGKVSECNVSLAASPADLKCSAPYLTRTYRTTTRRAFSGPTDASRHPGAYSEPDRRSAHGLSTRLHSLEHIAAASPSGDRGGFTTWLQDSANHVHAMTNHRIFFFQQSATHSSLWRTSVAGGRPSGGRDDGLCRWGQRIKPSPVNYLSCVTASKTHLDTPYRQPREST